jgi:hypothetical protein
MLTIERVRGLLGQPDMTDEEVKDVRDILSAFANTFIDDFLRPGAASAGPRVDDDPDS